MKMNGTFRGRWIFLPVKRRTRRGQTLVEYGLILVVVSIIAIGVLIMLGNQTKRLYSSINSQIERAAAS